MLTKISLVQASKESSDAGYVSDWDSVVDGVAANNALAIVSLYRFLNGSVKFYLYKQLGPQDVEDCLHDVLMILVMAIQRGDLRKAEALPAFAHTVARRQVAAAIDTRVRKRRSETPIDDNQAIPSRSTADGAQLNADDQRIMVLALRQLCARDRDILMRFYVLEQGKEQICNELGLSETQFRLIKTRAKAKFTEVGQRYMNRPLARLGSLSKAENKSLRTLAS